MYIFSGNATIFEKTFKSGHFWAPQNDVGGRTLGGRQQDLGTPWLSRRRTLARGPALHPPGKIDAHCICHLDVLSLGCANLQSICLTKSLEREMTESLEREMTKGEV